jgi:hypothetical protein
MEVFSKIIITDFPRHFNGVSLTRWQRHHLCILDKPFKVMEDIEGLLNAASWLLDTREVDHVLEPDLFSVRPDILPILVEGASTFGVDKDSLIENAPYSLVVFLRRRTRRVEILG